jgi:ATP-binding cassette, subfamily B, bacterial HlyB/CyaB
MLSFLDRPADPDQLRHILGKGSAPLNADDLVRLSKKLDVRARKVSAKSEKLDTYPLPVVARRRDGHYVVLM